MPKFKVVSGSHVEGKKTFKKGDIVTSEQDLASMFIGKFTVVGGEDRPAPEEKEAEEEETKTLPSHKPARKSKPSKLTFDD